MRRHAAISSNPSSTIFFRSSRGLRPTSRAGAMDPCFADPGFRTVLWSRDPETLAQSWPISPLAKRADRSEGEWSGGGGCSEARAAAKRLASCPWICRLLQRAFRLPHRLAGTERRQLVQSPAVPNLYHASHRLGMHRFRAAIPYQRLPIGDVGAHLFRPALRIGSFSSSTARVSPKPITPARNRYDAAACVAARAVARASASICPMWRSAGGGDGRAPGERRKAVAGASQP
jgi:hypothetical protein